jgi:hypothetical protein
MRALTLISLVYLSAHGLGWQGTAHAADESGPFSASAIEAIFPGSFNGVVWGAVKIRFTALQSGRLTAFRGDTSDTGTWDVRGDKLCITLRKWLNGKWRCSHVYERNGWYKAGAISFRPLGTTIAANR